MARNSATIPLLVISVFLALGIALSSIATSSCKLVKRQLLLPFDDDIIINAWSVNNQVFGLFTWFDVDGDFSFDGAEFEYNIDSEKCQDDWEDFEFDAAHEAAQVFGILTPIWAFLVLIMISVGVFAAKTSTLFLYRNIFCYTICPCFSATSIHYL